MEIIEKQVEKVKEVPADNYGYNYGRRDINGKANAGLTLGIIGTALGAWALFGGRRSASLLGGTGTGSGADANIAIATCGGSANGVNAPTAFQAWEKECEDTLALQAGIYNLAMTYQNNRFMSLEDRNYPRRHEDDGFMDVFDSRSNRFGDRFRDSGMRGNDMDRIIKYMRHSMNDGEHFTESEAMDLVSDMYHTEGGRKYSGEKFDIHKAKEICERYRGVIPVSATPTDVYVAINSQYHDYVELFKSWFGDNVDQKIIESAIIFWFKDVDCKSRNKVVSYFKEY